MSHRRVFDAVLWRTRTCSLWRDLPVEYGNWKTIYNRHRRWSADGTWVVVLDGLRAGADQGTAACGGGEWVVGIDATIVRAHAHAAGARHAPPVDVDTDRLISVLDKVVAAPDTGGAVK